MNNNKIKQKTTFHKINIVFKQIYQQVFAEIYS